MDAPERVPQVRQSSGEVGLQEQERLSYLAVLDLIHRTLLPRTYLDIGVQNGHSLALALDCTRCVGVDPAPNVLVPLPPATRIERCTSDEFFERERDSTPFGERGVDLVFIDGLHLFEYALRDFANSEAMGHESTIIVIDDCLPRSREEASRERMGVGWTGDVWKVLYYLREKRPDLGLTVIHAPPTGLAIVRGLDPQRSLWLGDPGSLVARYGDLDYECLRRDLLPTLSSISAETAQVLALLPPTSWQTGFDVDLLIDSRAARRPSLSTRARRLRRRLSRSSFGQRLRGFHRGGAPR